MDEVITVPTCVSGTISRLKDMDIGMDGATHLLQPPSRKPDPPEPIRLKGRDGKVERQLDSHADTGTLVTACGNWVSGAELDHLDVYSVDKADLFVRATRALWDGELPWPH